MENEIIMRIKNHLSNKPTFILKKPIFSVIKEKVFSEHMIKMAENWIHAHQL